LLKEKVAIARTDSLRIELLRGGTIQDLTRENAFLMDQLPSWWEKPSFTVPITALVVLWAVLRAVNISI